MFRTYELLMRGGLLSASLWLGFQVHAQDSYASDPFGNTPKQGFQAVPESESTLAPEDVNRKRVADQLREAKLKLQQGQREEALRLTARAASMAQQWKVTFGPNELSPQKMIAEIRNSARTTPGTMLSQSTEAQGMTPGVPGATAAAGAGSQADHELAQSLLRQAHQDMVAGQFVAARENIEKARSLNVTYGPFDVKPDHLMSELARLQPARPEGPSETLAAMKNEAIVPKMDSRPTIPESQLSAKEQAVQLMADAKVAMSRGHFNEARELALQAQKKDVAWGLLEEGPEHLLSEIARVTNKQVIAGMPAASESQDAQQVRTAALELLKQARTALNDGKFDEAQAKAAEAQQLGASYALFDDRPDLILQEARMLQARNMMEPKAPAGAPAEAAPVGPASQQQKKQQALAFLGQAREAMRSGDVATAEKLVAQAEGMEVAFGLFEDNPEVLREDLNRLVAAKQGQSSQMVASRTEKPAAGAETRESLKSQAGQLLQAARQDLAAGRIADARTKAAQAASFDVAYDLFEDSPERLLGEIEASSKQTMVASAGKGIQGSDALKNQAKSLLASARADLTAGRVEAAREKAMQAATIDVTYDLFEDSPERVLAETNVNSSRAANVAMNSMDASEAELAAKGMDLTKGAAIQTVAGSVSAAAGRDRMVVNSNGKSAQELFDEGVNSLRGGDREGAYEFFLQAYHSGETLDTYRQQQLQDKLRELSPRRRGVQTVSNEVASSGPIDAVAQQRSAQFDKVRTECLNAIFRAEKIRDKQPEQAVALLNQALETIKASDLSEEQAASLTAWVKSSRSSVETYIAQHAPVIELERKNAETKDLIEREIQTRVRVEQELANLVQKYNELYEQKRFSEASAIAKQAAALDANNPAVVTMDLKAKIAMRDASNKKLISDKETSFWEQLNAVEMAAINPVARDDQPLAYPENWEDLKKARQKRPADALEHTEAEMRVRRSLDQPVSLHFNNAPLSEVLKYVADTQGINVMVDETGLTEEAVTSSTPISINVDGIKLRSALNLILDPLNLGYTIQNEVLNVTSRMRKHGDLTTVVYQVADLVVPVTPTAPATQFMPGSGFGGDNPMSVAPKGLHGVGANGNGFAQVGASPLGGANPALAGMAGSKQALSGPSATTHGFEALNQLITTTVSPESWSEMHGSGSIKQHDSTLSLVIRQTQQVHQEIADLLDQLRRLQDLQVTIEVRFITVSDQFFEQIGIDFDFNINDTVGGPNVNNDFSPIRPFGSVDPVFGGTGGGGSSGAGTGGSTGGSSGGSTALAPFGAGPRLNMQDRDNWPSRTVVGLLNGTDQFTPNLDVPFRQGSFDLSAPTFGGFDPNAGINFGLAILSDIEAFMFVRAAQGDRRSNVMFAPKVTIFNGQFGTVRSGTLRPFVTSLQPVASAFQVGYVPEITTIPEGTTLMVTAVVSADRRYVRLSVLPTFYNVTDVFTFSYISAGGTGNSGGGLGGGGGGGNNLGGGGGGTGGGGGLGGGGNNNNNNSGAVGSVTVQLPVVDEVFISTVVSVPDGGTVLLGGVKSLREGRNMAGVPILNKIPYISRLFKNSGVGRETESLMMMVTPRIIIQEEQEQLLGIPQ